MDATAKEPGIPGSTAGKSQVGEHIHQLLNLAAAIINAAARSHSAQVADITVAPDSGSFMASDAGRQPNPPFGLNVGSLSDGECLQWARDLEHLGRFQQALSVQVAAELADRVAAGRFLESGVHSTLALLVQSVKISATEARRRIRLSETLLPVRDNITGAVAPTLQAEVGQAFFHADLSADHALMIANFVEEAQGLAKAGLITRERSLEVQSSLVATGKDADPDFLRQAGNRIMAHLDPDGQKPTEGDLIAKQGLFFRKARRGLVHFDGHMCIEQYEHFMAAIGTATNPNKHGPINPAQDRNHESGRRDDQGGGPDPVFEQLSRITNVLGSTASESARRETSAESLDDCGSGPLGAVAGEDEPKTIDGVRIPRLDSWDELEGLDPIDPESTDPVVKDVRTRAQKLLDGLLDCVKLAARTGHLPLNGGLKPQLILTTTEEDINRRDGTGTAFTPYSGPVPLHLFEQSLCDPDITHLYMGQGQDILNVGRAQRLFTPVQRKILFARDLGCSFPDCTMPAHWTEAHHIIPWQHGGETNINNATLLCSYHHSLLHHSDWTVKLKAGTPYFKAPYLIDPSQTERRNYFHHGLLKEPEGTTEGRVSNSGRDGRNSSRSTSRPGNFTAPECSEGPDQEVGAFKKTRQEHTHGSG